MPARYLVVSLVCATTIGLAGVGGSADKPGSSRFAVAGPGAAVSPDLLPIDDPFPILRIRAFESDLPAILKQNDVGPLVQLKRGEFEAQVRSAARQLAEARTIPRITHTRYAATLIGNDLVGTAELDLANASSVPKFLTLDPLRLALSSATWADGREAVLGVPPDSSVINVWMDRPGLQTLMLGWSAAGSMEFGERRFELRIPPALSTSFELELPLGQRPTASTDVLLNGPFPVPGNAERVKWKFRFGGRTRQLDFTIRSTGNYGTIATSTLAARYDIAPGLLTGTFEYDLRPAKGTVGEWAFTVDPGLRVTDVVVSNRAGWSVDQIGATGGQRQLRVNLNQPGIGGKVMVSCMGPFPDPTRTADSPLPMIRPVGALLDDETLEINLSPDLKPVRWIPGDFRLADSQIHPDQSQKLILNGTLLPSGAERVFRQPPTLTVSSTEPEFAAKEQISWRFDADHAIAQVQLGIRVRRGPLFRVILRPPSGYTFIKAGSPREDLISFSAFSAGAVLVEFSRPLMTEQSADIVLDFRGPPTGPTKYEFPLFTPVGAAERIGVLGIIPGLSWEMDVKPGVGMTPTSWLDLSALRPPADSAISYRYRGSSPEGSLTLSPVRPHFTTAHTSRVENTRSQPNPQSPARSWDFSDLYLVSAVRTEEDVEIAFGGTVNSSAANLLPIGLPPGARVRAIYVNGRLLEPGTQQLPPDGKVLLPMPSSNTKRFEVWYALPVKTGFVARIRSADPVLPVDPTSIQRYWAFATNLLPYRPIQAMDRSTAIDFPILEGKSSIMGSSSLVARTESDEVQVCSVQKANAIGVCLAAGIFLVASICYRWPHPFSVVLLLSALFVVGTAHLLGAPWWQRLTTVPLGVGLPVTAGLVLARRRRYARGFCVVIVLLCSLLRTTAIAQPTAPAVVVVLPHDAAGQEYVVAPKALLDRVAAIARPMPAGALISAADLSVSVEESSGRVVARFSAYAFGESNTVVQLPLSDARLEKVMLGGKPAFPNVLKNGLYSLPLPSSGRHEIEVHFTVPFNASGTERELHFGVPECPITRVTALFPGSARQIQLVGRTGKRTLSDGNPRRVEVDAGSTKAIQFRWRDGIAVAASMKLREACVWDVGEKGADLTACYHIRVDQGTVSTLRFELPSELEPVDVSLRSDSAGGTALRDWSLGNETGGFRQLQLDLQGPTSRRMLVILSCRFKKAVAAKPILRFPKPMLQPGNTDADITYGLRAKDSANKVAIEELARSGVIDYDPGVLTHDREWTQVPALRLDTNTPILVFRPTPGTNPILRPTLRPVRDIATVNVETSWQVGPARANANGTISWNRKEPVALLEFALPGVHISEVRGAEVGRWNQNAGHVYVWLRRPIKEGELEWTGTTQVTNAQTATPVVFEAAIPRVLDSRLGTDTLRIRPLEKWLLRAERDRGWTPLARKDDGLAFQSTNPTAMPVRVLLTPDAATPPSGTVGQLTPLPPPHTPPEKSNSANVQNTKAETQTVQSQVNSSIETHSPWILHVSAMFGWTIAFATLAMMMIRFPQSTWPEQFGLVTVLFCAIVLGHWWLGLAGWFLARTFWLNEVLRRSPEIHAATNPK